LRPLTFNRLLTSLACHGVQMFVRLCYLGQPIFRNIAVIVNSAVTFHFFIFFSSSQSTIHKWVHYKEIILVIFQPSLVRCHLCCVEYQSFQCHSRHNWNYPTLKLHASLTSRVQEIIVKNKQWEESVQTDHRELSWLPSLDPDENVENQRAAARQPPPVSFLKQSKTVSIVSDDHTVTCTNIDEVKSMIDSVASQAWIFHVKHLSYT